MATNISPADFHVSGSLELKISKKQKELHRQPQYNEN